MIVYAILLLCISWTLPTSAAEWQIRTCSGCKLNRLPEVRKFVKDESQALGINVKYIHGRNPDLVKLDDNGDEIEIHDLSGLDRESIFLLLKQTGALLDREL